MFNFSQINKAIVDEYKNNFIFNHCILQSLLLPELNTIILKMRFSDLIDKLLTSKQDEKLFLFLQALAIKTYKDYLNGNTSQEFVMISRVYMYATRNFGAIKSIFHFMPINTHLSFDTLKEYIETEDVKLLHKQVDQGEVEENDINEVLEYVKQMGMPFDINTAKYMFLNLFATDQKYINDR